MASSPITYKIDKECLNQDFNKKLQQLDNLMNLIAYSELAVANEWLQKLLSANSSIEEMQLRNEFISYLVKCTDGGVFRTPPFNAVPPPCGSLLVLKNLLPRDHRCACMSHTLQSSVLQKMLNEHKDAAEYLGKQPVPRDGIIMVQFVKPRSE